MQRSLSAAALFSTYSFVIATSSNLTLSSINQNFPSTLQNTTTNVLNFTVTTQIITDCQSIIAHQNTTAFQKIIALETFAIHHNVTALTNATALHNNDASQMFKSLKNITTQQNITALQSKTTTNNINALIDNFTTFARNVTDALLFSDSLHDFLITREKYRWMPTFDWSSNGCSGPVLDHQLFRESCYRHDFGYRNFKKQERCGGKNRENIDTKFYEDMKNDCKQLSGLGVLNSWDCFLQAWIYYQAVKIGGLQYCMEPITFPTNIDFGA